MSKPMFFFNPAPQFFTNSGVPLNGGLLYFYSPGSTTPITTYTDNTLGTPNSNPVVLDSTGRLQTDVYVTTAFKLVLKDSAGNTLKTEDNITTLGQLVSTVAKTANYTVLLTDRDKLILCDASAGSFTLTLPASATAGDGFNIKVKKTDSSVNTVTLSPNGAENIDNTTSYTLLTQNDYVELYNNATKWLTARNYSQTFKDANGNTILNFSTAASAVNYVQITDAATTAAPSVAAAGSDTNVNLKVKGQGTGAVALGNATLLFPNADGATSGCGIMTNAAASLSFSTLPIITKCIVQTFTTTGTYTPTTGMQYCIVEMVGAGAGGGGVATTATGSASAGGGGGGAYCKRLFTAAQVGASGSITCSNSGGAGGVGAGTNGTGGGNTSITLAGSGTITMTAPGGLGANSANNSTAFGAVIGGVGGSTATNADFAATGRSGEAGRSCGNAASAVSASGKGGDSLWGAGGNSVASSNGQLNGNNGTGFGSGGGGASGTASSNAANGGNGAPGLVVITEYCNS